ncbi:hypothetical protein C7T94_01275 [Pedobacter yulinensis]|uniref:Glutathionylspermidine synthase pre-ATP-grasp-like domain-containing protein n=1 Tax=Pedobacter yulinensis TaxID=2126353 RepID=A0A2T3HQQ1_9SPHI|nr:hypothetical protein [Pedobacter yulinensis]PST84785.1 hypothetical protein C7T94_01275 [Pedobacter yulinensis]
MIPEQRAAFNRSFTVEKYRRFLDSVAAGYCPVPFRLAETPVFIPAQLRLHLEQAGKELLSVICRADFKELTKRAIPDSWQIPNENGHPHFLTFDFAVCQAEAGQLFPQLIEMQGFPSLYGFQQHLADHFRGIYDIDSQLSHLFGGLDRQAYLAQLREVVVGSHNPEEVVIMDTDIPRQKTLIDFLVTRQICGIGIVSLEEIRREGRALYYLREGRRIPIRRIYNRLIFDEIAANPGAFISEFDPRLEADIEWVAHPNWFYRISKFTMPLLNSTYVPECRFLHELNTIPPDLENYVLKPLFSFGGAGVNVDVTQEDIKRIPDPENWILQRKVVYAPVVRSPSGFVKAEIRLLYLWPDGGQPQLCTNLVRLSRGPMIGVRYNQDCDWVGGTIGFME